MFQAILTRLTILPPSAPSSAIYPPQPKVHSLRNITLFETHCCLMNLLNPPVSVRRFAQIVEVALGGCPSNAFLSPAL